MTLERDAWEVLQVSRSSSWPEKRAAYRALARRYHPDGTTPDRRRMVEINAAYERLELQHRHGTGASPEVPIGFDTSAAGSWTGTPAPCSGPAVPPQGSLLRRVMNARHVDTPVVDFGQYAGRRIGEIADHDPRYLRWLSRQSSGIRFRAVIEQVLGPDLEIGRRAAILS